MSTAAAGSAASRCPRCGVGLAPDQDWCTSCGLAVTTRILPPPNVRGPLAIAIVLVILAGGGIGLAVASLTRNRVHAAPRSLPPRAPLFVPTGPAGVTGPTGPAFTTGPTGPRRPAPTSLVGARRPRTGPTPPTRSSTTGAGGASRRSPTGPTGPRGTIR